MKLHKKVAAAIGTLAQADPVNIGRYLRIGQDIFSRVPDAEVTRKSTGRKRKPRKARKSTRRGASSTSDTANG